VANFDELLREFRGIRQELARAQRSADLSSLFRNCARQARAIKWIRPSGLELCAASIKLANAIVSVLSSGYF